MIPPLTYHPPPHDISKEVYLGCIRFTLLAKPKSWAWHFSFADARKNVHITDAASPAAYPQYDLQTRQMYCSLLIVTSIIGMP